MRRRDQCLGLGDVVLTEVAHLESSGPWMIHKQSDGLIDEWKVLQPQGAQCRQRFCTDNRVNDYHRLRTLAELQLHQMGQIWRMFEGSQGVCTNAVAQPQRSNAAE